MMRIPWSTSEQQCPDFPRRRAHCAPSTLAHALILVVVVVSATACNGQTAALYEREDIVPPSAQVVTDQGMTLDQQAEPWQVAYVLMRAIYDDVKADDDVKKREAAYRRELAVCAADTIYERAFFKSMGRDQFVRRFVWHWAPTWSYYVDDFPTTAGEAKKRMHNVNIAIAGEKGVPPRYFGIQITLSDPSGDPNAQVVADMELYRENGMWRVLQVGFFRDKRTTPGPGDTAEPLKGSDTEPKDVVGPPLQ